MRIGINGRFLVAKKTGVQRAAYNLIKSIIQIDDENEYYIFSDIKQKNNPDWQKHNVKIITSNLKESESIWNHIWEQFYLPRLAYKYKIDILHSPANMAPLYYKGNSIVNIHDVCFLVNPQWYSFAFRTLYKFVIPRLAKTVTKIITNSNNSKNDILQFFKISCNNINLIYWAVDNIFEQYDESFSLIDDIIYNKEDYILYVGSLEPRKNILTLIEAYELMRLKYPHISTKLILIGGESPLFAQVKLKTKHFSDDLITKGFVNDNVLKEFYKKAKLVVYPSLYEGFGLPPLEAMASGSPVVTSNTSSIPEIVEDAAILVNPYDKDAICEAMYQILSNKKLARTYIIKGLKHVKKFNWNKVARNTISVYYEVYKSSVTNIKKRHFIDFELWKKLRIKDEFSYQ